MVRLSKKTDIRQQRLSLSLVPQPPKKWQSYLKKQKQKRWLKNLMFTLGTIFAAGIIISVFRLGWWLGQPLGQAPSTKMEAPRWSGRQQINLLISVRCQMSNVKKDGEEDSEGDYCGFLLVSLHSTEGTLKILTFPPDLKIPDTKGTYTLPELLRLAAVQNPPQGIEFVIDSLEKYLAIPIDGYIVALSLSTFRFSLPTSKLGEIVTQAHRELQSPVVFLKIPMIISFIKNDIQTNLSPGQVFRGIWEIRGVRFDKLEFYELPIGLPESERDVFIQNIFEDPQIVKERLKISVKNASETPGLALQTARFIENIGGEVIEVENSKVNTQNPKVIVYSAPKDSLTVKRLENILGVPAEWVEVAEAQRADIEVIVTH